MSLKAELDAFRSDFMAQVPPEVREAMVRADMELAATGIAQKALKAGDCAPDFNLPDARGGYVRLEDLLAKGPVVLGFYRGGWCPYCNLELRALQQALPEITRLGAKLVAVSPQTPDESLSTTEKNGDESWVLPIPGTYVIDTGGTVALGRFQNIKEENIMQTLRVDYLNAYRSLKLTRDAEGVPLAGNGQTSPEDVSHARRRGFRVSVRSGPSLRSRNRLKGLSHPLQ